MELLAEQKRVMRAAMRAARNAVPATERAQASRGVCAHLAAFEELARSSVLVATLPVGGELSIEPFCREWLANGRVLAIPAVRAGQLTPFIVTDLGDLRAGHKGCPEPDPGKCPELEISRIEAVLLPGLAFDRAGRRLGQGGGHFDRLLARLGPGVLLAGVAYGFQIVEAVPFDPARDRGVHWVASPEGLTRSRIVF